jgi:hypothetical protein
MDPTTAAIAKAVAKETIDVLKTESESFLSAALGEPAKAFGGLIADKINARRHQNLIKITAQAKERLAQSGVSPKEVPLNIIHPALEAASLEENVDLQARWANLLANAADPRQERPVSPTFSGILKDLNARDAQFLDALYERVFQSPLGRPAEVTFSENALQMVYANAGLARRENLGSATAKDWNDYPDEYAADVRDFSFTLEMVLRHRILIETSTPIPVDARVIEERIRVRISPIPINVKVEYSFTHIGACFVAACQNPRKTE